MRRSRAMTRAACAARSRRRLRARARPRATSGAPSLLLDAARACAACPAGVPPRAAVRYAPRGGVLRFGRPRAVRAASRAITCSLSVRSRLAAAAAASSCASSSGCACRRPRATRARGHRYVTRRLDDVRLTTRVHDGAPRECRGRHASSACTRCVGPPSSERPRRARRSRGGSARAPHVTGSVDRGCRARVGAPRRARRAQFYTAQIIYQLQTTRSS